MVYLAVPVAQMQTGPFSSANCGPSVTSLLLSMASVDAVKISAQKIRDASGDRSGGIEGALLASTANRLTGHLYPILYRHFADWSDVRAVLEHASIGIIIDCSQTIKTKYRTNNFTGLHWVTVAGGTIKDGTVKVEDPGTTMAGWQRWPLQLLRAAADLGGNFWFLDSPQTEDCQKNAVSRTGVFAKADLTSPRLGSLDKGKEVHVRKTVKGGPWRRDDGTNGRGWHQIDFRRGTGFVKGEGLR
jgi:hypothetical protein